MEEVEGEREVCGFESEGDLDVSLCSGGEDWGGEWGREESDFCLERELSAGVVPDFVF